MLYHSALIDFHRKLFDWLIYFNSFHMITVFLLVVAVVGKVFLYNPLCSICESFNDRWNLNLHLPE